MGQYHFLDPGGTSSYFSRRIRVCSFATGVIPSELGHLAVLSHLRLEINQLSGEVTNSFCGFSTKFRINAVHCFPYMLLTHE